MVATDRQWLMPWLVCVGLITLIAIGYHAAPQNGFHLDDEPNIVEHAPLHVESMTLGSLHQAASNALLKHRYIPNFTLAVDWWRGGGNPAAFLQTNVLLHALNALLIFVLYRLVLQITAPTGTSASANLIGAAIAAGLWAAHPIQTQAVTYAVQRMAELSALFTLMALFSYIRSRIAPTRWGKSLWMVGCGVALLLAVNSKENAWIAPLLLLITEYGVIRHIEPGQSRLDRWIVILVSVATLLVLADLVVGGPLTTPYVAGYSGREFTLAERLLTQPRVVLFHLSQWIWPDPGRFSIFHDVVPSTSLLTPWTTLPSMVLALVWFMVGTVLLARRTQRVVGFFMLWFAVSLLPESSFVPLEMVFEHRMYLPTFGVCGLVALAVQRGIPAKLVSRNLVLVLGMALLILLALATQARVSDWQSKLTLYSQAIEHAPNNQRAHYNLANALRDAGRLDDAIGHYRRAGELGRPRAEIWNNLGATYEAQGQWSLAAEAYQQALQADSAHFRSLWRLGALQMRAGAASDAERLLRLSLASNAGLPNPWIDYADSLIRQGKDHEAQAALARGVTMASEPELLYNYRGKLAALQNRLATAESDFRRAVAIRPDYADAWSNLGGVHLQRGDMDAASVALSRALQIDPTHVQALANIRLLRALEQNAGGAGR